MAVVTPPLVVTTGSWPLTRAHKRGQVPLPGRDGSWKEAFGRSLGRHPGHSTPKAAVVTLPLVVTTGSWPLTQAYGRGLVCAA